MVQDHVHMLIHIPPKYSVAHVIGYIKGKLAIAVARQFSGRQRNFNGESFWARGYAVSTVGYEKVKIQRTSESKSNWMVKERMKTEVFDCCPRLT